MIEFRLSDKAISQINAQGAAGVVRIKRGRGFTNIITCPRSIGERMLKHLREAAAFKGDDEFAAPDPNLAAAMRTGVANILVALDTPAPPPEATEVAPSAPGGELRMVPVPPEIVALRARTHGLVVWGGKTEFENDPRSRCKRCGSHHFGANCGKCTIASQRTKQFRRNGTS